MRKKDLREMIEFFNSTRDKTPEELKREEMRRDDERQHSMFKMRLTEIESKNRVDISLSEYNRMKDEIAQLKDKIKVLNSDNSHLTDLLIKIGVPNNLIPKIIPDSIRVAQGNDIINFTRRIRIEFDIDEASLRDVY